MKKYKLPFILFVIVCALYVSRDNIADFYHSVAPKNTVESGATSTGHSIKISERVRLDRTSAKSDTLVIQSDTPKTYYGYFNTLNFDSDHAVLFDENTKQYYLINLQTLDVITYSKLEYNNIKNEDIKFKVLKKHYDFPWMT
ncbi:hypothetical protein [Enterococcus plantarum]|uniref:hypothetical protein n=1 Tax=Enterococcus plantarum TaxID=1077675 RepID=UPI001A8E4ED4|nr:hypothetical protein [Enterococcus plantarum]MBO0422691.1 hypothetical protein [Enterococcus plantarum]